MSSLRNGTDLLATGIYTTNVDFFFPQIFPDPSSLLQSPGEQLHHPFDQRRSTHVLHSRSVDAGQHAAAISGTART